MAAGAWLGGFNRGSATPSPVVRAHLVLSGGALGRSPNADDLDRLALSPDGRRLAYVVRSGDRTEIHLRDLNGLESRVVPGTTNASLPFFSPDGEWLAFVQNRELRKTAVGGGGVTTIARNLVYVPGASWGDDGYIVFSANYGELLRVPADGRADPSIVIEGGGAYPQVLPGGHGILVRRGGSGPGGQGNFCIVSADGNVTQLPLRGSRAQYVDGFIVYAKSLGGLAAVPFDLTTLATGDEFPVAADGAQFTASSTVLVYNRGMESPARITWVTREGRAIDLDSAWNPPLLGLALSPDGTRLAFDQRIAEPGASASRQVWVKQLPAGSAMRLSPDNVRAMRPDWKPDGSVVTYTMDDDHHLSIYSQRPDGSRPAALVHKGPIPIWEVQWSPTGWLAFRIDASGGAVEDFEAIRPGLDSVPTTLIRTSQHQEAFATFSPDGKWMAYTSDENGRYDVFVRPFPNTADAKWQVSVNGGDEPLWSRGGDELFYRKGNQLMVATVSTKGTFSVLRQQTLPVTVDPTGFGNRSYDVDVGDRRFIVRRNAGEERAAEVVVVTNFLEEVRAVQAARSQRNANK
jgi:serine/threonine-protein kinase